MKTDLYNFILLSAKTDSGYNWKEIVKTTLIEIYGQSLKHYSASGKRSERPGIDIRLYKGLHGNKSYIILLYINF